jgi:hypothetical protein
VEVFQPDPIQRDKFFFPARLFPGLVEQVVGSPVAAALIQINNHPLSEVVKQEGYGG